MAVTQLTDYDFNVVVFTDASTRPKGKRCGVGIVMYEVGDEEDPIYSYFKELDYTVYGQRINVLEYSALVMAATELLTLQSEFDVRPLFCTDSMVVAHQVNGVYSVLQSDLLELCVQTRSILSHYSHCQVMHIPREWNTVADWLSGEASGRNLDSKKTYREPERLPMALDRYLRKAG